MQKILVVDDQRNLRATLAMMLRDAGFAVDEAKDGATGGERGATGAYDLVITDLRLGDSFGRYPWEIALGDSSMHKCSKQKNQAPTHDPPHSYRQMPGVW